MSVLDANEVAYWHDRLAEAERWLLTIRALRDRYLRTDPTERTAFLHRELPGYSSMTDINSSIGRTRREVEDCQRIIKQLQARESA